MDGLHLSDWASDKLFRRHRLAQTLQQQPGRALREVSLQLLRRADPDVDLEKWTLTVEGMVQHPGDYKLSQIQAFPKVVQNTRHVCVEGWDVIGNFGGTRASDFLRAVGADLAPSIWKSPASTTTTSPSTWRPSCNRKRSSVTRCTASRSIAATARRCVCRCRPSWATSRPSISTPSA